MPEKLKAGWETIERKLTLPVPYLIVVEAREDEGTGRWFARSRDLGVVVEASATTRAGAIARLERLIETALAKLVAERALAG